MKYAGIPDSKSIRKEEYIENPSYCCTLMLRISRLPLLEIKGPIKKGVKPPLPFKIDSLDCIFE